MTKTSKAPKRGVIVTIGRTKYRVDGSELQGTEFVVRLTRMSGRGVGGKLVAKLSEIQN